MAKEEQKSERKSTRYDGVYQYTSRRKKHEGKPDVTYMIDYRCPHSGKRIRRTIGSRSEGITAEYANSVRVKLLADAKREVLEGLVPLDIKNMATLGEAFEKYREDWLIANNKASTQNDTRNYETHIKPSPIHSRPLNKIVVQDLESIALGMKKANYAPQTIKGILGLVRRVMKKAKKWRMWRGEDPFEYYTMPEVDNERTRYYSKEQLGMVFNELKKKNYRAWMMALIALQTGLRFSDIAKLEVQDINFEDDTLFIRRPKNRRSRYVRMTPTIREALQEWIVKSRLSLVFPSAAGTQLSNVDDDFFKVVNDLGLNDGVTENRDRLVFHSLRHTYASFLAKEGYSEMQLAQLLGQSSTEMAKRYTHLMPSTQHEAAAHAERVMAIPMGE